MEYNSDYEVRLATLGALGGDTTKKYDSVYSIDLAILEAIEQGGGGGGLNYNQIKELLASSGVTEIVVNGDGESITLDYSLLAQIGGGMTYDQMKQLLVSSGLTEIVFNNSGGTSSVTLDYGLIKQIGSGLNYDQIKQLLASSGITEIVVNGDGVSITLDYDLLSQIGQGGMDYEGIKDALSASTSGVTSIYVHNSGNTTGITMDYDLLNQIGQGVTYDQMKQLLASSGVTEIVFKDGVNSVTLDYEKVTNIGMKTVVMTQAEYDALVVKDNNTIYYTTSSL